MAPQAEMGEMDPKEKRENQGQGSEAHRALQGKWDLQEILGRLGLWDQSARKETLETLQVLRLSWQT